MRHVAAQNGSTSTVIIYVAAFHHPHDSIFNHFCTISVIRRWRELILYDQVFRKQSCRKNCENPFCFYFTVFKKAFILFFSLFHFTIRIRFHFISKIYQNVKNFWLLLLFSIIENFLRETFDITRKQSIARNIYIYRDKSKELTIIQISTRIQPRLFERLISLKRLFPVTLENFCKTVRTSKRILELVVKSKWEETSGGIYRFEENVQLSRNNLGFLSPFVKNNGEAWDGKEWIIQGAGSERE